jgi:hypothetical protein
MPPSALTARLDLPACSVGVAAHEPDGLAADLHSDVHVAQRHSVGHVLDAW